MTAAPEVSVIVPVYKGVSTLRDAVGSLVGQTFADWECLLVDDGSKDGSGAVADELAAGDGRILVIHQPNGGTSAARNTGLDAARGRYIAFLDEDDAYHPRYLEILHGEAEKTGAEITGCDLMKFEDRERPAFSGVAPAGTDWRIAGKEELREWLTKFYYGIPFEVWRNLYRRELVADSRFELGVRVEQDLRWQYSLLPRVTRYAKTIWQGYAWRQSATGGYLHPDVKSVISLLESYRRVLTETAEAMELTPHQLKLLGEAVATDIRWNVWRHLRAGLKPSFLDGLRIRRGLWRLNGLGARLDGCISHEERRALRRFLWMGESACPD